MKRPNPVLYVVLGFLLKVFAWCKGQRIKRTTSIQGPAIVLCNHTSFHDFVYTTTALYPKRVTYLAADKMFYDPLLGFFLRLARAIPKCLFQNDLGATLKALKILKQNGIVAIFPEGQISPIGVTMEYNFAIAKLVKKADVPVYVVRHKNAYLVNPPWTKKTFRGHVYTEIESIASKEETHRLTEDELNKRIAGKLAFNTHAYNEIAKMKVRLNDIANLESVIYRCPTCGGERLEASKVALVCPDCGAQFVYDAYGKLGGHRIDLLYREQERIIREAFERDPGYKLAADVRLETYRDDRVKEVGGGRLEITRDGYRFEGDVDGKETTYEFSPRNIPTLPSDLGINVQIYRDNRLYQFVFNDIHLPTKFVIAGEAIHRMAHATSED
jgi:1-acyl-sn-glycerol-3-phosphate acyltransferase/DNA-directed RNA polymerase subunit RPC12/RpoP